MIVLMLFFRQFWYFSFSKKIVFDVPRDKLYLLQTLMKTVSGPKCNIFIIKKQYIYKLRLKLKI